jgi:dienelactone hydrolase
MRRISQGGVYNKIMLCGYSGGGLEVVKAIVDDRVDALPVCRGKEGGTIRISEKACYRAGLN